MGSSLELDLHSFAKEGQMRDKNESLRAILDCGVTAIIRAPDAEREYKLGI